MNKEKKEKRREKEKSCSFYFVAQIEGRRELKETSKSPNE